MSDDHAQWISGAQATGGDAVAEWTSGDGWVAQVLAPLTGRAEADREAGG